MSSVLGNFWRAAYTAALPTSTAIDDAATRIRNANSIILRAAFTPLGTTQKPPLTGAPLIELVSDGLKPIFDRIEMASTYHDFGCRFKRCNQPLPVESQVSELWRLLSTLNDSQAFTAAVDVSDASRRIQVPWVNAFKSMRDQHVALQQAEVDARQFATDLGNPGPIQPQPGYADGRMLLTEDLSQLSLPAIDTARMVQASRRRYTNYRNVGSFGLAPDHILRAGISDTLRQAYVTLIENRLSALDQQIAQYRNDKEGLVRGKIEQIRNQARQEDIRDQLARFRQRLINYSEDLAGMRSNIEVVDHRNAELAQIFNRAADFESRAGFTITRPVAITETVRDSDAKYLPSSNHQFEISFGAGESPRHGVCK